MAGDCLRLLTVKKNSFDQNNLIKRVFFDGKQLAFSLLKQQKRAWTTRPDLVDYLANLADKRDLSRAALFL